MLNIICVCTGDKYHPIYIDNLKYMIDKYSNIEYDTFNVIDNDIHEGVFNKLQMFEKFTIDYNIYFDLDVIIRGDCNKFISQALSVINAWWRPAYHTPINSSIISWYGNKSYIYKDFMKQPDYYMVKYNKGMDQYLYENHEHITFPEGGVCSYQTILDERDFSVYLFNQMYKSMQSLGWYSKYLLPQFVTHWQHYQDESQSQPL
jgi:hypothetical protein